jgi:nascent polypeptide-associated complex subunit alpha
MMPNIDPRQMEQLMRKMGMSSKQLSARKVVIETEDDQKIVISDPQVTEITMQGQKSFQIAGNVSYQSAISEEDVKMVMDQSGASKEAAIDALKRSNGDIAEAILLLQESK